MSEREQFSVEQAAQYATEWCAKHPAWMRICDIPVDTDQFYIQWDELSEEEQECWGSEYGYNEFSIKPCKMKTGHISGKGEFYPDILQVPLFHNSMMVFRVGTKQAKEFRELAKETA